MLGRDFNRPFFGRPANTKQAARADNYTDEQVFRTPQTVMSCIATRAALPPIIKITYTNTTQMQQFETVTALYAEMEESFRDPNTGKYMTWGKIPPDVLVQLCSCCPRTLFMHKMLILCINIITIDNLCIECLINA